jgi:ADP-ribose pyrophosphatase YjhB (NUDIX family)
VQRVNEDGELEILLSDTGNKPWTHQPFGGKRDKDEGPVQTMVRELREEAGQVAADKLVSAFENGNAYYYSTHIQMLGNGKALLIHGFAMNDTLDSCLVVENGDDSKGYLWASAKHLEGKAGKKISLTEQGERVLEQIFGFKRSREELGELDNLREGAKDFRHPDFRYFGDPTFNLDTLDMEDGFTKISRHADWVMENTDPQSGHLEYGNALLARAGLQNLERGEVVSTAQREALEDFAKKLNLSILDGLFESEGGENIV